ncbi:MAG: hypothetical protein ACKVS8_14440 [Phycisphaerales bacterium]
MSHTGNRAFIVACVCALAALCGGGCDDARAPEVALAFDNFAQACEKDDGAAATALLCESNHRYYARIRDFALTAPKKQLLAVPRTEAVEALTLRMVVPVNELRKLDGAGVFRAMTDAGAWRGMGTHEARRVKFTGKDIAWVRVALDGEVGDFGYEMRLEGGGWKVDFQSPDKKLELEGAKFAREEGLSREELIMMEVEGQIQQEFDPVWWDPPK